MGLLLYGASFMGLSLLMGRFADDAHFAVQGDAEKGEDPFLDMFNQCLIITCCTAIHIHHEAGMLFRNFDATDPVALKPGFLDKLACKIPGWSLEDAPA